MQENRTDRDILIYGNAGCFPERDLRYCFGDRRIAVAGPLVARSSKGKIRWYRMNGDSASLERLFHTYTFGAAVFVSDYLTYGNVTENEAGELRNLFRKCRTYGVRQVVCLVSQEYQQDEEDTDRRMDRILSERLCRIYADEGMKIAFVGCPYLADPSCEGGYLRSMFAALENGENWSFPEPADKKTDFIAPDDVCAFLARYLDVPQKDHFLAADLENYTEYTFGEAAKKIQALYPERSVRCMGEKAANDDVAAENTAVPPAEDSSRKSAVNLRERGAEDSAGNSAENSGERAAGSSEEPAKISRKEPGEDSSGKVSDDSAGDYLKKNLGWFAHYDVFRNPEELRASYLTNPVNKAPKISALRRMLRSGSPIVQAAEILGGAIAMEFLTWILRNSIQFRMIDARLLYVVLIASVYGMKAGFFAALLACISLTGAYAARGISPAMLFFDPTNWLAFAMFFAIGGFCGLERERHDETNLSLSERIGELEQENDYTDQLYREALDMKKEYRQNLIQSRDGFGRIYSAVQKLAVTDPSQIYGEAIGVIEEILDNHSVAIYSVSARRSGFARLEVSSKDLKGHREKSIRLSDLSDVVKEVGKGEIWVNRRLIPGKPMYAYGISSGGELRILLVLWEAGFGQMSAYYENQIRVIGGLTQTFMLTAWSFQEATADTTRISGTNFLTEPAFQKELYTRHEMADRGVASYTLFRIKGEGRSTEEMSELLKGKLRDSDLVTRSSQDGDYYVLALQSDASSEKIILDRFRSLGLDCRTVEIRGGAQ